MPTIPSMINTAARSLFAAQALAFELVRKTKELSMTALQGWIDRQVAGGFAAHRLIMSNVVC